MRITLEIKCPTCLSDSIKKNGIKVDGKQNYQCKDCKRQFIGDHALSYLGCNSGITRKILQLMVRGSGIRDIAEVERISIGKVLRTLTESTYQIQPKQSHYESLEVDEFWTFVGNKNNKQWLIYAFHRETGEIVAYVWGKRDLATVQRLKTKLKQLGIHYTRIASDHWDSFITAFKNCKQSIGKFFTVGIEGNNCKIRHRIRRGFRRSRNFSKKIENHFKAFDLTFFTSIMASFNVSILFETPPIFNIFSFDKVQLTLDRTNWKWGKRDINILMLAIVYRGIAIPIVWTLLNKRGNSDTKERIALIQRF
ncbi:transposase [Acinetobacter baumannii]|uniref:Transposon-related protein n=22 Tax=Moraxellaceae TaxID=468 RepID=A0A125S0R3_ACIBA|nr:transposon-related protein [Acinetobacter baumannii]SSU17301.1 transposase [Acinetobacter baumannii]SSU20601.1 transposase [Acinetobacter baumannii]SSV06615.1 transposase [Acinetobacter baumannii]SSV33742.1 transposase [Acinetobacter baumannii]